MVVQIKTNNNFSHKILLWKYCEKCSQFNTSHLNIISLFILYSFFSYHHLFFIYSFPMKSVISTTFSAILSQESHQNLTWKVVISFNLNLPLKLFFYSSILANNNLLLKIYCENIVVTFLNCHFLFFILFFLS